MRHIFTQRFDTNVQTAFFCNYQKMEPTQVPINKIINKYVLAYPYNTTSHQWKEWNIEDVQ
jgi:hypothetical protein